MATIPEPNNTLQGLIDAHYEKDQGRPRPHLGASLLGHPCDRWLWLSFRWAVVERFPGRILRLFERGQREEESIVSWLRAVGIEIHSTGGEQSRVDFGSHVSGSLDGIIEGGVPGAEKTRHVAEFKTHSLKSFNELKSKGVFEAKPQHYAQMQAYMMGTGIDRALYVAVCKDNDEIYSERVRFDKAAAEQIIQRGKRIALTERIPEPLSADPSWWQCKFCAAHDFCFGSKTTKEINCRTCAHSTPMPNSTWTCARWGNAEIPLEEQYKGCASHVLHPDLVPWQWEGGDENGFYAVYVIDGQRVMNGEPDAHVFSSQELLHLPEDSFGEEEAIPF